MKPLVLKTEAATPLQVYRDIFGFLLYRLDGILPIYRAPILHILECCDRPLNIQCIIVLQAQVDGCVGWRRAAAVSYGQYRIHATPAKALTIAVTGELG